VEIERFAPFICVAVREVVARERVEVIPVRTGVIVNDVKNDGEADAMGFIDEMAEVVGRTVETGGGEEIDAVIPPPEAAWEIGDRHDLEQGDPELRKLLQFFGGGSPCSFRGEGADMHFV